MSHTPQPQVLTLNARNFTPRVYTWFLLFVSFYRATSATACNATHGSCEGLSVRLSIRLSIKRVHCDQNKETCAHMKEPLPQRSETLADVIVSIQNGFDTVIINVLMLKRTSSSSSVSEKKLCF